jgi:hypothetical protein
MKYYILINKVDVKEGYLSSFNNLYPGISFFQKLPQTQQNLERPILG